MANKINKKEFEIKLNEFYNKWITLPGAPQNSHRYICHEHTEELADYFGIKLQLNETN